MASFGIHISIDRYHRSNIKLCDRGAKQSQYFLYIINNDRLEKYSYDYTSGLEQLQLVSQSDPLPTENENVYYFKMAVTQELEVFVDQRIDYSSGLDSGYIHKFDNQSNLIATSPDLKIFGGFDFAYDPDEKAMYLQRNQGEGGHIVKLNESLDIVWDVNNPEVNHFGNFAISNSGRLYLAERWTDATIWEINKSTGSPINSIDLQTYNGNIERSRNICPYIDNRMVVVTSGSNNDGYVVIINEDLSLDKIIDLSTIPNAHIDGGTGITNLVSDPNGNIAICTTADPEIIYLLDPVNEQLIWKDSDIPDWSLGDSRPINIASDTYGNFVIRTGIGSDTPYVIAVKNNGEKIVQENIGQVDSRAIGAHYTDIVNYL